MKKLTLTFLFLCATVAINAQDLSKPKNGNAIRLKDYNVVIKPGSELEIPMWVVKSKKYKLKLKDPVTSGTAGIDFQFTRVQGEDPMKWKVKLNANKEMKEGTYNYIIRIPGYGRNAVKNALIMVKVVGSDTE